jgi:hypothetical protein
MASRHIDTVSKRMSLSLILLSHSRRTEVVLCPLMADLMIMKRMLCTSISFENTAPKRRNRGPIACCEWKKTDFFVTILLIELMYSYIDFKFFVSYCNTPRNISEHARCPNLF